MAYKKIITMTAWRRPDYTKQVIENLKRCIGFEEYTLLPTIEPGYPEILKAFDGLYNCEVIVNDQRLGCTENTLKALQRGFNISDFVIHMEDDTVPGIDSLKYFEWIYKTYKDDKKIFTASAFNRISKINPKNYFTVYRCHYFTGWMWSTWIDRFEEMIKEWNFPWDVNINKNLRGNRYEICPSLPRSQNIGEHLGTYTRPGLWKRTQYSPIWVNNAPDISNILSSNILPPNISHDISELSYFEIPSTGCPIECNIVGIAGIIGITYLYLKHRKKK